MLKTDARTGTVAIPGLASFAGAELPDPDSRLRKFTIRGVALFAIAISLIYLAWRVLFTLDVAAWWLSVPLVLLELHALAGLGLFTFSLWDVNSLTTAPERHETQSRVAVLIPTFNEPVEVLLPTIAAAVALRPAHQTWVLDDGDRQEVRALAERLGARYLARTDHSHAKAGNINNALQVIDVDLVAVLDADHVADPGFLTRTLGYFDDPKVAVVQTPQDFYNLDSFEHDANRTLADRRGRRARFNEQALFYRAIEPGKNRWDAAFWCGTGAVVRVSALREVGGVATETVTEDIHTTIRLHRRGWRTVYHNQVLARGLAASDAQQYQAQRLRWGIGAMQVLRTENPLLVPGLTLRQRISYGATLLGWFDAWRSLGYLVIPPAVLFSGAVPIRAEPATFAVAFCGTFLVQRLALALLGRGFAPQGISTVFELVRMTPNLRATLTLFRPGRRCFKVTPKGRMGEERSRTKVPTLLWLSLGVSLVAALWFTLSVAGRTPLAYNEPWAAYGAAFWLAVNSLFVLTAIRRIRSDRFAGERRASVRFDVAMPGRLEGNPCQLHDISLTGARVGVPLVDVGALRAGLGGRRQRVSIPFGADAVELDALVRSVRAEDDEAIVGLEFEPGQDHARARLALALFNAHLIPALEPAPPATAVPPVTVGHVSEAPVPLGLTIPDGVPPAWVAAAADTAGLATVAVVTLEEAAEARAGDGAPVAGGPTAPAQRPWRRSDDDVLPASGQGLRVTPGGRGGPHNRSAKLAGAFGTGAGR